MTRKSNQKKAFREYMFGENVWFFFDEHIFEQIDEPILVVVGFGSLAPVIVQGYSRLYSWRMMSARHH